MGDFRRHVEGVRAEGQVSHGGRRESESHGAPGASDLQLRAKRISSASVALRGFAFSVASVRILLPWKPHRSMSPSAQTGAGRKPWPRVCCSHRSTSPRRTPMSSTTGTTWSTSRSAFASRASSTPNAGSATRTRISPSPPTTLTSLGVLQSAPYKAIGYDEFVGLDQTRHGDGAPHHALHRRAACAGRPRRTVRRRRPAGRVDECRSGSRTRIQRVVQRRAPAAAWRGARRAVRAPLQFVRGGPRAQVSGAVSHDRAGRAAMAMPGRRPPTRPGPSACGRISATCWRFAANATSGSSPKPPSAG